MFAKVARLHIKIATTLVALALSFPSGAETPREILGVSPNATEQEIKTAYKNLAKTYHPNALSGKADAETFSKIKNAYDTLMKRPERAAISPENFLRQQMAKRLHQLRERSDYEPLHVFLSMFYDQNGRMISVAQVMAGLTPQPLQPAPEAEKIYLEYFKQMARPIWFLHENPNRLEAFVDDFYGRDMASGAVHFLVNVFEQAEIFTARSSYFRTRFTIGGETERKITDDLLSALRDMCLVNFDDCAEEFLTKFDRHPELYALLTREGATKMIDMSDFIFRHRSARWFFSTQYWQVFNARKELMRTIGTPNLRAECAKLLLRHGRDKVDH